MKHIIDKSFNFCYGHRVHNQQLDTKFTESGDACLKCRHLHGHEGLIKVFLEEITPGENINRIGMVTDFKHLGWFKNFIDDVLDHKMILDINDPLNSENLVWILDDDENIDLNLLIEFKDGYYIPDMSKISESMRRWHDADSPKKKAIYEKYEGIVLVDFVPTSENLAGWLLTIVQNKMEGSIGIDNIKVNAIEYRETPKSHCRVEAQ